MGVTHTDNLALFLAECVILRADSKLPTWIDVRAAAILQPALDDHGQPATLAWRFVFGVVNDLLFD